MESPQRWHKELIYKIAESGENPTALNYPKNCKHQIFIIVIFTVSILYLNNLYLIQSATPRSDVLF